MKTVLITGCGGLIGSEATGYFSARGHRIIGLDNDMRAYFFGKEASTHDSIDRLRAEVPRTKFLFRNVDIRDRERVDEVFRAYGRDIELVVHTAAQPSHDWAAKEPHTDFFVNAVGTLNLLEATRQYCTDATFVHCSTSKVYGDNPNRLRLLEKGTRYDLEWGHKYYQGIDTSMSIDQCLHSLFGASKASADLLVQEYGRYFNMPTVCFRPGCLTGPNHKGAPLHGFLAYLIKACNEGIPYTVHGYKGMQVRCNIHSYDLVAAFEAFHQNPTPGAVYNIGGGRVNSCSMLEAIEMVEGFMDKKLDYTITDEARIGDHMWWISNNTTFELDYPWRQTYSLEETVEEMVQSVRDTA